MGKLDGHKGFSGLLLLIFALHSSLDQKSSIGHSTYLWTTLSEIQVRVLQISSKHLEPKQFKNNLIMFEDKPQFEFTA